MGKSPGKWIKTVLFGKKSSKSNISKDVSSGRKISSAAKAPSNDLAENPSVVLEPAPQTTNPNSSLTEYEAGVTNVPTAEITLLSGMQGAHGQGTTRITSADGDERNREHEAATKAQAAFRGYLARRAFWALKGIIRLQALVRGHLVRRQAVATLQCMHAIVKFQVLVRGRIVRHSDVGHGVYKFGDTVDKPVDMLGANMFLGSMKQSSNPYLRKLLSSSPVVMPLSLQYDLGEPNSAWMWLERWSSSRFWIPLARPKMIIDAKFKRKQASTHASTHAEEIEAVRPKRSVRKIPAMNGDSNKLHSSEHEKPKRNPRKSSNHQPELVQEQPQSELEKVKRNLRKVTSAALVPEAATEKPLSNQRKTPSSALLPSDVPEAATEEPLNSQRKIPSRALLPSDVPEAAIEKPQNNQSKIPSSALVPSDVPESANDKSQNNHKETPGSPRHDASEEVVDHSSEKPSGSSVALPTQAVAEEPVESLAVYEQPLENLTALGLHSLDNTETVENNPNVNEDRSSKEDKTGKESQKRRRNSTPVKQEYPESLSQNSPTLPSYMQATQSAKAKLRAQEAQRFGNDDVENGFTRRHSLPASTNVKLSTPSPRMQKPLQTNGKVGSKSNRSLTSSRDDKSLQAGWRR